MTSPLLQINHLKVNRQDTIICNVEEFEIQPRERVAVIGPNGSGKTTLLRVIAQLESSYSGDILIDPALSQSIYVHQTPVMFRGTVLFNARYGLICQGVPPQDRETVPMTALETLGIASLAHRSCRQLSGGEKRRVAIARAAIVKPALLLLDEPFADIDQTGSDAICELLFSLTETAIVVASPQPVPHQLDCRKFEI